MTILKQGIHINTPFVVITILYSTKTKLHKERIVLSRFCQKTFVAGMMIMMPRVLKKNYWIEVLENSVELGKKLVIFCDN